MILSCGTGNEGLTFINTMTFHLLSEELRHKIPRIGSNPLEPLGERIVHVRFFDPTSNWRWYVMEYDGDETFFGLVLQGRAL